MTSIAQELLGPSRGASGRTTSSLIAAIRSGLADFIGSYRHRKAMDHLAELDDYLLKDIGVTRDEIRRPGRLTRFDQWLPPC